ncbi:MAG: RNA-directed DNA polymerase [Candidatus Saccharibacteria bacterium]|nr:RNA-directed DNA polymerase [Candidatus Saccharibacteria bacterium]
MEEWLYGELLRVYYEARAGKRKTLDEQKFELYRYEELKCLVREIITRTYHPSAGIAFIVTDPVQREIFAAPFRDRVIHHFLYNMVAKWWDKRLNYYSSSCRKGKGTLFAIRGLQKHMLNASQNNTQRAYCIKFDLSGYFMSLPKDGLLAKVQWGLERQYPGMHNRWKREMLEFLWREVIYDKPTKGVKIRGKRSDWRGLPTNKSLFHQPEGNGIVIGNLTSQLLSNIYLDTLDRFITEELKFPNYGRYVDDFYIVVSENELSRALEAEDAIRVVLDGMRLRLNERKTKVQEVRRGCEFVGGIVYPKSVIPNHRTKRNYLKVLRKAMVGEMEAERVVTYRGIYSHFCRAETEKKVWKI